MASKQATGSSIFTRPEQLSAEPPQGHSTGRTVLAAWCVLVGLMVAASTIYGAVRNYSPIPYLGQWDGLIDFWRLIQSGSYGAWWAPHDGHRVVMSRILFWIDMRWFGGVNIFTIAMNVILHLAIACVFVLAYARYAKRRSSVPAVTGIALLASMVWMRGDNFNWGFQSEFALVYLFAMLAFLCYALSTTQHGILRQALAFLFATGSMLSMANGLLSFPLLIVIGLVLAFSWQRLLFAAMVTSIAWVIYFAGYQHPPIHSDPANAVQHHLLGVLHYALLFLGSPVKFLGAHIGTATAFGGLLVTGATLMLVRLQRAHSFSGYRAFLAATFVFVVLAALLAGVECFGMGIETAASSRYTTPGLVGWLSVFLLFADMVEPRNFWRLVGLMAVTIMPLALWSQRRLADDHSADYKRAVAVIGVTMGVHDDVYLSSLYPKEGQSKLFDDVAYIQREKLSIYGRSWVKELGPLQFDSHAVDPSLCRGAFDSVEGVPGGYRLRGWAVPIVPVRTSLVVFTDSEDKTVGYGVVGEARPDVQAAIAGASATAGWRGYVVHSSGAVSSYLYTQGKFCPLANNVAFVVP